MAGDRSYNKFEIDLSVAGSQRVTQEAGYLVFLEAVNSSGVQQLDALVNVAFGAYAGDPIPFRTNNTAEGYFREILITWPAQSGWTAKFFLSRGDAADYDRQPLRITSPPTKQLVTAALASNITTSNVVIGATATLLAAARATRQAIEVQSLAGGNAELGNAAVTYGSGLLLQAGFTWRSEKFIGALYGITTSGSANMRVVEEY